MNQSSFQLRFQNMAEEEKMEDTKQLICDALSSWLEEQSATIRQNVDTARRVEVAYIRREHLPR